MPPASANPCKCLPAGASGKAAGGPAGSAAAGPTGSDREDFHRAVAAGGSSPGVAWLFSAGGSPFFGAGCFGVVVGVEVALVLVLWLGFPPAES